MNPVKYYFKTMDSPVGILKLVTSDKGMTAVLWEKDIPGRIREFAAVGDKSHPILLEAGRQLREYFDRKRKIFSVPLDLAGTIFQKKAWDLLTMIPFGETRTYGQQAIALGNLNLARAVGSANHRNPVSIIVPCHRLIGSTGSLTGFAGGLEAKAYLLALEGAERLSSSPHTSMY
jgi:methylated-DNA-[protein]-cysteine S-methyltransferase